MRALLLILGMLILSTLSFATISASSNQITIDFDYVYKDVYIAQQGDTSWTLTSCSGSPISEPWYNGCSVDMSGESGVYSLAIYACDIVNNQFDCNNNQWRIEEVALGEQSSTDFSEKPTKYLIGSGKDLLVNLGDDYPNIDSATFQIWHFDQEQVQADVNDFSAPFVYPGSVLDTVSPGKASVEVFLREGGVTVKTLKFDTTFVVGQNPTVFACSDGLDNDYDGKVDLQDPGCSSTTDNNEYNAPPTCSGDCTTRSITQYGITWTFDKAYEYGQFANGDYWVKGPVTLTEINVKAQSGNPSTPTNGRNGFEISPGRQHNQAYDNRAYDYQASRQPSLPVVVQPGNNIVNTISSRQGIDTREYLHLAAILTVVEQIPPGRGAEVFRPPYVDPSAPYRYVSELQLDKIPSVDPPTSSSVPNLNTFTFHQNLPQFQNKFGWRGGSLRPKMNLKPYPVDAVKQDGQAMLLLTLNTFTLEQKMPLLLARVQTGIDLYALLDLGGAWPADGGHNSGRLIAITMAGHLLNDQDMLTVSKKTDFAEIQQTFYTTKNPPLPQDFPQGNTNPNPSCYGKLAEKYAVDVPGMGKAYARYGIKHALSPSQASVHGEYVLCSDTEGYSTYWRLNAPSWSGQACAARLFGIEDTIDHPAFFDHMDRFMDNDIDNMADWMRVEFSDAMWYKHCDPWR